MNKNKTKTKQESINELELWVSPSSFHQNQDIFLLVVLCLRGDTFNTNRVRLVRVNQAEWISLMLRP